MSFEEGKPVPPCISGKVWRHVSRMNLLVSRVTFFSCLNAILKRGTRLLATLYSAYRAKRWNDTMKCFRVELTVIKTVVKLFHVCVSCTKKCGLFYFRIRVEFFFLQKHISRWIGNMDFPNSRSIVHEFRGYLRMRKDTVCRFSFLTVDIYVYDIFKHKFCSEECGGCLPECFIWNLFEGNMVSSISCYFFSFNLIELQWIRCILMRT